ncbi:hypothetical protein F5Y09DRAFT_324938 [Xylaria sp. FL1042]|nr:hypothetical protein F5Y09DRAFT_324938 [Xylaria sp. FL1042]
MTTLPSLTDEPMRHPGCCLSLSQPLLATIRTLLQSITGLPPSTSLNNKSSSDAHESASRPEPALILSIGSGTGLLEELLHVYLNYGVCHLTGRDSPLPTPNHPNASASTQDWRVEGVEVNRAVNIHLPEDRINQVAGTWAIHESRARDSAVLMFVYPRDGALVRRYIEVFMASSSSGGDNGGRGEDEQVSEKKHEGECMSENERIGEAERRSESESVNSRGKTTTRRGGQLVLWLGPKCDWGHTGLGSSNSSGEFEVFEMRGGVGLAEYEMLAALRPKTRPSE